MWRGRGGGRRVALSPVVFVRLNFKWVRRMSQQKGQLLSSTYAREPKYLQLPWTIMTRFLCCDLNNGLSTLRFPENVIAVGRFTHFFYLLGEDTEDSALHCQPEWGSGIGFGFEQQSYLKTNVSCFLRKKNTQKRNITFNAILRVLHTICTA